MNTSPTEPETHISTEPGIAAREVAASIVDEVLRSRQPLDDIMPRHGMELDARDRSLARAIATVTFRRLGTLDRAINERMQQGLPPGSEGLRVILLTAAAQLLFLDVPDHAAVDCAVRLIGDDKRRAGLRGFINAVLRRVAREKAMILAESDALADDTPPWLAKRWIRHYGEANARAIAEAHREEPPLDLTVRSDPEGWADKLDGIVLPTGSVRLNNRGAIETLAGFLEGQWWVQDAAAALPARLLKAGAGQLIADVCAAPGGKTLQIAATGATVVAVDRSRPRLERLRQNLTRMHLDAEIIAADATTMGGGPYDAILIDAPCSATGTIRRHPDVAWSKQEEDLVRLAGLQRRLIDHALTLLRPGGTLVYCTCSLEPEEGEQQVAALLKRRSDMVRIPILAAEIGDLAQAITPEGDLRTLPSQLPNADPRLSGWAGFYAARLARV